jgi:hypothetical protein
MAQWIANMILLAALVAAIWYAWETRTMRLDMIRPKVLFLTRQHQPETLDDMTSVDLFVRNVGNGTAMNISVEHLWDKSLELRTDPEHIPILEKGQEAKVAIRPVQGSYRPDISTILDDLSVSLKLLIRYVDVEGHQFRTSTAVGGGALPPFVTDERV